MKSRAWPLSLAFLAAAAPGIWWMSSAVRPVAAQSSQWPGFDYFHEFFGPDGYSDPQVAQHLNLGMMTGLSFTPPVAAGVGQVTRPFNAGLMLRLPGAAQPAGISTEAIEQQRVLLDTLARSGSNAKVMWDLLPEWDQSGGLWVANGRPNYSNLTRAAAHAKFQNYYRTTYPSLFAYLRTPISARPYLLAAVTDYAPNVFDAYEMGVDVQLLERGVDELGDLATGIAHLRGAANQYGKAWGIDISTWRSGNGKATAYATNGQLQGGWSESYLRRLTYASYFAGANIIHNEAATYRYANGALNPFGQMTQEFADFALRRHPDLGKPAITTALLVNADAGFDPKHGAFDQRESVWYRDIPYSGGDTMSEQFLRLAYPDHWLHGLAPGASFADANGAPNVGKFQSYLNAGGDARPYEPMPSTRWGDQIDILTTRTTAAPLQRYRMIILMGDVTLDANLRQMLFDWVSQGGILLMNSTQAAREDQAFAGVVFDNTPARTGSFSRWTPDDRGRAEAPFSYTVIHPDTAEIWAVTGNGDPLVTSNKIGAGQVIFTTPAYLEPMSRDGVLSIGVQLLDWLFGQVSQVSIDGSLIAYAVNNAPGKTVVALFNTSGAEWNGRISVNGSADRVLDYVSDQPVAFTTQDNTVAVQARVAPYDLKIIAVEYTEQAHTERRRPQTKQRVARPYQSK